jgi:hypothetical protein
MSMRDRLRAGAASHSMGDFLLLLSTVGSMRADTGCPPAAKRLRALRRAIWPQ